ncbi:hypothetical protein EDD15DRAFT_2291470 [Pisolithus albus]|nr:hypothetical protein EDD15DRAFT_2291470 [Pisolithus albus]
MALDKRIVFKKSPKCLKRLLFMLGMAPEPPKIRILFSNSDFKSSGYPSCNDIKVLLDGICDDPATSDCLVVKASWYKRKCEASPNWMGDLMRGVSHDFLRFDILSPDKVHTSIYIAERFWENRHSDGTQSTYIDAPLDTSRDVAGDSTAISADESDPLVDEAAKASGKTKQEARSSVYRIGYDHGSWATMGSRVGAVLEWKHRKATCVRTLTFPEGTRVSAQDAVTLLAVTSRLKQRHSITEADDWFVKTVFEALKCLFEVVEKDTGRHWGRLWNKVLIPPKGSVNNAVCTEYYAALEEQAEEKNRREEKERWWKEHQALHKDMKKEREQSLADMKRAHERYHAAEERVQALEEEMAKLQRELEAVRAGASSRQV